MFVVSAPGWAADNSDFKIRVIQEDGSVQELDVRKPEPAQKKARSKPKPAPQARAAPRVKESDLVKPSRIKPSWAERTKPAIREPVAEAIQEPEQEDYQAAPEQIARAPDQNIEQDREQFRMPYPQRKPSAEEMEEASRITEDVAIAIALDTAPPSQGFNVYHGAHRDQPVFVITFKTDDGPYQVLIDAWGGVVANHFVEAEPVAASKWPVAPPK